MPIPSTQLSLGRCSSILSLRGLDNFLQALLLVVGAVVQPAIELVIKFVYLLLVDANGFANRWGEGELTDALGLVTKPLDEAALRVSRLENVRLATTKV